MFKLIVEFLGTFLLMFSIYRFGNQQPPIAALTIASTLFVAILLGGSISGGHFNPAVTFGMFLDGNIANCDAVQYLSVQLLAIMVAFYAKSLVNVR